MIILEMKNYNMTLTEKPQKYQHYHQLELIKNECVAGEEILPSNRCQIIEQARFTFAPLEKAIKNK